MAQEWLAEAQRPASEVFLKFATERVGISEATRKQAEDVLASHTTTIEALKQELAAAPERTQEEIATEVDREFMVRHGKMRDELEEMAKDLAKID